LIGLLDSRIQHYNS